MLEAIFDHQQDPLEMPVEVIVFIKQHPTKRNQSQSSRTHSAQLVLQHTKQDDS
jgi:hypothetical protein